MNELFPYANVIAAILILVIGVGIHFLGQLTSLVAPGVAVRLGLLEDGLPPEMWAYENAIAKADVLIGWTYAVAAVGLLFDEPWGYVWAWIPGVVFVYHAASAWFWEANRRELGYHFMTETARVVWCGSNLASGLLAIVLAATA